MGQAVDVSMFKLNCRYVVNGDLMRFIGTNKGYGSIVHYLFMQPAGGWIVSYTNIDFYVGDIAVEAMDDAGRRKQKNGSGKKINYRTGWRRSCGNVVGW